MQYLIIHSSSTITERKKTFCNHLFSKAVFADIEGTSAIREVCLLKNIISGKHKSISLLVMYFSGTVLCRYSICLCLRKHIFLCNTVIIEANDA